MDGSFAHEGINPQMKKSALFFASLGIARTGCDGAMLKRGANLAGKVKSANASCRSEGSTVKVKRPHRGTPFVMGIVRAIDAMPHPYIAFARGHC